MIPNSTLEPLTRRRYDTTSFELRAYARDEWRSDAAWLRGSIRPPSFLERLHLWRRSRTRDTGLAHREVDAPVASPAAWTSRDGEADCPHVVREDLGLGGPAQFLRCSACGEVLVVTGSRSWGLAPIRVPPRERCTPDPEAPIADP